MRRFYPDPSTSAELSTSSFAALAIAATLTLYGLLSRGPTGGAALVLALLALVPVVVRYASARLLERVPLLEITDTHLRWRRDGAFLRATIPLARVVSLQNPDDATWLLVTRDGLAWPVPIDPDQFSGGTFAVEMALHELRNALPRRSSTR